MPSKAYCSLLLCLCSCFASAHAAPVFAQAAPANDDYEVVIASALREFDAGHFEEARALFLRANAERPSARTSRALGFAEFELRHYAAADKWLRSALSDGRNPLTAQQRADVERALGQIRTFVGRYRIESEPSTATLKVDGQAATLDAERALLLEVGEHTLIVSAPGFEAWSEHIDVRGGEDTNLRIVLTQAAPNAVATATGGAASSSDREPGGARSRVLPWAIVGGGGALSVTGVVLLILGRSAASDVENPKDGATYASIHDAQKRAPLLSNVGIALTAAGLCGVGVGIVLLTRRSSTESAAPAARVALNPAGVQLQGAF